MTIIHYHFRPGGVRRVIELATPEIMRRMGNPSASVLLAAGEPPDGVWLEKFRLLLFPLPVEVKVLPGFAYLSEQPASGAGSALKMRADLQSLLAKEMPRDSLVWAHNLGVGRNLLLARELVRACKNRRVRLLAHQHDWWFDSRWQRWAEFRRCGFCTVRAVAEAVFPAAGNFVHATINREDASFLEKHFPGRVQWLPNPAEPEMPPDPSRVAFARRWLRGQLETAAPVWLLPCRLLRRKNIGEALLLARWLRPEAWLVTTGGASSSDETAYAEKLEAAACDHGWPLRLGILAGDEREKPAVAELVAASEAVMLTSIQEGFGLPNLEAAAAGRPLIARRLPNIAPDLAGFGFRFPQSYGEILVAPGLFDWSAEVRRQDVLFRAWLRTIPLAYRGWAGQPALLACRGKLQPVAFGRLTLTAQLEVLARSPEETWNLCAPLNPFLRTWKARSAAGGLKVTAWPHTASKSLGGPAYAARFEEIARARPRRTDGRTASLATQEEFLRARLASSRLFPLLWAPRT